MRAPAQAGARSTRRARVRPVAALGRAARALTTRGRSFALAGIAMAGCAFLLGERDLLRVAALVLALPAISGVAVARAKYTLSAARRLVPVRCVVGAEASVQIRLENSSRLPARLLLLRDELPYVLGDSPRFLVGRLEPHGSRELEYRIRSDVRGRHRIGPLSLCIADPFGLVEVIHTFSVAGANSTWTVTPEVVALPARRTGDGWSRRGESSAAIAMAAEDDVAVRAYSNGDDLRRVHWRSTARHGELMVRREDQRRGGRAVVVLDGRAAAHTGSGPGSSFEVAVSAAASIGARLHRNGARVRLVGETGELAGGSDRAAAGPIFEDALLDALAMVRPSTQHTLGYILDALRRHDAEFVVLVLGVPTAAEAAALATAVSPTSRAVAVLCGHGATHEGDAADAAEAERVFAQARTQTLRLDAIGDLAEAWGRVGGADRARLIESGYL